MSYLGFCPPGVIFPYAGSTAPEGWLLCNGQEVSQTIYPSLYAALSFDLTVTTANGSPNVTTATTANIAIGAAVSGTGIQSGSYVVSITNSTTFVLNLNATASGTVSALFKQYDRQTNPTTGSAWAAAGAGNFRVPDYRGIFLRGVGTASALDTTILGAQQAQKTAKNNLQLTGNISSTAAGLSGSVSASNNTLVATGGSAYLTGTTTFASSTHGHALATGVSDNLVVRGVASGPNDVGIQSQLANTSPRSANTTSTPGTATVGISSTAAGLFGSVSASNNTLHATGGTANNGTLNIGNATPELINETRPINKGVNYIIKI